MAQLYDIVKRNPTITSRKAGQNMTAGLAVYLSAAETVKPTPDENCGGYAFDGVTVNTKSSGEWMSVATEPSEVYVNASGTVTAGKYVTPAICGTVINISQHAHKNHPQVICGRALQSGTAGNPVLIRLMNAPNLSTISL